MIGTVVLDGKNVGTYKISPKEALEMDTGIDWVRDIEGNLLSEVQSFYLTPLKPEILFLSNLARAAYAQYIWDGKKMGDDTDKWVESILYGLDMTITIGGEKLTIVTAPPNMNCNFKVMASYKDSVDEENKQTVN